MLRRNILFLAAQSVPSCSCGAGRLSRSRGACSEQKDPWFLAQEHCTLQPRLFAHWCLNKACTDQDPSQSKLHISYTLGFIEIMHWAGCDLFLLFWFVVKKINLQIFHPVFQITTEITFTPAAISKSSPSAQMWQQHHPAYVCWPAGCEELESSVQS